MWADAVRGLEQFPDAVLTGVDQTGHPLALRCRPRADHVHRVLRFPGAPGVDLRDGPACLLAHSHDEHLWTLRSFLVRGVVTTEGPDRVFTPCAVVPGNGMAGPVGDLRTFVAARRRAGRYLRRRRLPRPRVPWRQVRRYIPDETICG